MNFTFEPLETVIVQSTISITECQAYVDSMSGQNTLIKVLSVTLVILVFVYLYLQYTKNDKQS